MKGLIPLTLALWAGVASAEDVAFFNGDLTLTLPPGMVIGRSFGEGSDDGIYAVDLINETIETVWTNNGRADELPDMDRMEAAFGLTFPSQNCADYTPNDSVLPTRCKQAIGMSLLAIPRSAGDSGARLGVQLGMAAADVDALWANEEIDQILTAFCSNDTHTQRFEASRYEDSIICTSDRPALAPHFVSFRLLIDADHAVVMYAQNVAAETDVIMTYGVDAFLELIAGASDIETTLFKLSEDYVAQNGSTAVYLTDQLSLIGAP